MPLALLRKMCDGGTINEVVQIRGISRESGQARERITVYEKYDQEEEKEEPKRSVGFQHMRPEPHRSNVTASMKLWPASDEWPQLR